MSWLTKSLNSSLGKKLLMSLTGLFIIFFLIAHVSGNSLLFAQDGGLAFNAYASFMSTNTLIQTVSKVNFALIALHIVYAAIVSRRNKKARPEDYAESSAGQNSRWSSRNMGILGLIILVFLVIHLKGFWYEMHYGDIPLDANGNKDLYGVVAAAYSQWWYAGIYVISMIAIAYHLSHGFSSAFQTLGLNHPKYTPFIKSLGLAFSIVVPLIFALMPVYFFVQSLT